MKVPRQTASFSCCLVKVTGEYTKSHFEQTANKCLLAYRCGKRSGNSEKGRGGKETKGEEMARRGPGKMGGGKKSSREEGKEGGKK